MTRFPKRYEYRDDHVEGYVYLIEAINVTGIIPGKLVRRCKIGLSWNPELRLQNFIDNQPPCDFKIVRTIYVEDMADVEDRLHEKFKSCNVKLVKSREWFNLLPWQYWMVHLEFNRYDSKRNYSLSPQLVGGLLIALLGVGLFVGYSMRESAPQAEQSGFVHRK
jgi:hypothetical protein